MSHFSKTLAVLVLSASVIVPSTRAVAQVVHFVDASATGLDDCSSWANACVDLQSAFNSSVSGDQIWVASGIYIPDVGTGDRRSSFHLISGVSVYGGFAGGEAALNQRNPAIHETILSGDLDGNDCVSCEFNFPDCDAFGAECIDGCCVVPDNEDNSYHVVVGSGTTDTAVLDGFTITAGNANSFFGGTTTLGAGLLVVSGSPSINNCTFTANMASFGGAVLNESASPTFLNCKFVQNSAGFGGAMDNRLSGSAPTLINCVFNDNTADLGGAMVNWSSSHPTIINSTFAGNSAVDSGGGVANVESSAEFTNCIFWDNVDSGGMDESAQVHTFVGTPTVNYSCVQGGWTGIGSNNISSDPNFVDAATGDLHLAADSLCIDSGLNSSVTVATDLDGNARIVNGTVDMGAYEYFVPVPVLVSSNPWDGYIDPRNELGGVDTITVTFNLEVRNTDGSPLDSSAFAVTSTGVSPPTVSSVDTSGNPTIVIVLSGAIELGEWTTITTTVESFAGVEASEPIDIGFLPDDINQSSNVNISDATAFVNEFNGDQRVELIDLNRSGNVNISDATEFVTIFNGGASGTSLPPRP